MSSSPIYELAVKSWDQDLHERPKDFDEITLEKGNVIYCPHLVFLLKDEEKKLLTPSILARGRKNISYDFTTDRLKGADTTKENTLLLHDMMRRFSEQSFSLVEALFPHYQEKVKIARTSFRPAEIKGRKTSYRKDDTRLHVDSFPSTPNQGRRLLRVFSNIHREKDRVWRLGEPFEEVAKKFLPRVRSFSPLFAGFLEKVKLTRGYRTPYDHYMLHMHHAMKQDDAYQKLCKQTQFCFPPQSTWIVMTDVVSHAALGGQHLLEQTFELNVDDMKDPALSPLRILERLKNVSLV